MKTRGWITVSALSLVSFTGAAGLALSPSPAPAPAALADAFAVDSAHSFIVFKVKHNNVAHAYGMFVNPTGTFNFDQSDVTKSSVDVSVKAEGVNTGNAKRDQHLRSPDFFSVKEFDTISFKSTGVKPGNDGNLDITGDLTMHGVTKPVTAKAKITGTGAGRGGTPIMGAEATFTVKRSDFGMTYGTADGALGDEVAVTVALEGAKR